MNFFFCCKGKACQPSSLLMSQRIQTICTEIKKDVGNVFYLMQYLIFFLSHAQFYRMNWNNIGGNVT